MAVLATNTSGHLQNQLTRSLERILEDANQSGELKLSNRKLKDFPKAGLKYNLSDTVIAGEFTKTKQMHTENKQNAIFIYSYRKDELNEIVIKFDITRKQDAGMGYLHRYHLYTLLHIAFQQFVIGR